MYMHQSQSECLTSKCFTLSHHSSVATELVGLSLVQKAPPTDDHSDYIVFVVNDIVLDYLQQNVPQQKQVHLSFLYFVYSPVPDSHKHEDHVVRDRFFIAIVLLQPIHVHVLFSV